MSTNVRCKQEPRNYSYIFKDTCVHCVYNIICVVEKKKCNIIYYLKLFQVFHNNTRKWWCFFDNSAFFNENNSVYIVLEV